MQVKLKHEQCRLNNINALVQHMGQDCKAHLQLLKSPQALNGCDAIAVQVQAAKLWAEVQALYCCDLILIQPQLFKTRTSF
jgi:hypothetical protein